MTIRVSDHMAPGIVMWIADDERAAFPPGTVITRNAEWTLTANVPVSKPGERDRVAHVVGAQRGTVLELAALVASHFPPLSLE